MCTYYHYCSLDSFLSIIQNASFRLGNPFKMNDCDEIKWLIKNLTNNYEFYTSHLTVNDKEDFKQMFDTLFESNNVIKDNWYFQNIEPPYIASLSEEGDILSQWRAYANNGKGVAIGFDGDFISQNSKVIIEKIVYDSYEQSNIINDKILCKDWLNEYKSCNGKGTKNWVTTCENILHDIVLNALLCKNPGFMEEKEYRIIYDDEFEYLKNDVKIPISKIKYRVNDNAIIPFREMDFSKCKENALVEIIIGPKAEISENEMEKMLSCYGYSISRIKISKSRTGYR